MDNKLTKEQAIQIKKDFSTLDGRHELPTKSGRFPLLLITPPELDSEFQIFVLGQIFTSKSQDEFDYLDTIITPPYFSLHVVFMGYAQLNNTVIVHFDFFEWAKDNNLAIDLKKYGLQ